MSTLNIPSKDLMHLKYRPDIDGLRAIAVLLVVGFHAFPGFFPGGFIGVDVFFVISGFLITKIIFESLEKDQFSFIDFYGRRIRRIFPALIVVMLACFLAGWIDLIPEELEQLGKHMLGGATFVSNLMLWGEAGYFDYSSESKPLLHLWSLGIEEQFYIFWPLILWLGFKYRFHFLWLIILLGIASFVFNIIGLDLNFHTAVFYNPFTRFWELLLGSGLAYLSWRPIKTPSFFKFCNSNIRSILGTFLLILSFVLIRKTNEFPGWWALLPTVGTVLILSANANNFINHFILSNRILVWFGVISFPLYLWHWPMIAYPFIMSSGVPPTKVRVIAVLSAVFLAWLTYKFVERPLRFGGRHQLKIRCLIITMALVGVLGLVTYLSQGFPQRMNSQFQAIAEQFKRIDAGTEECIKKYVGGGNSFCRITNIDLPPTAAILGDSHAGHFYWGLSDYIHSKGGNLINLGAGACPPFLGVTKIVHPKIDEIHCNYAQDGFKYILGDQSIKTVFLAFHHAEYFRNDIKISYADNKYSSSTNFSSVTDSLIEAINLLESKGKKVIILYDMPTINFDIKKCFAMRPYELGNKICPTEDDIFIRDFDRYNSLLDEVKSKTSVDIFYTHPFISGNFPITKNGLPAYFDSNHLTVIGSKFFVDKYDFDKYINPR
jgi:peptidoglycan/LPS O-acetylase OafA/YrhL